MGAVYRARDEQTGQDVAVKHLTAEEHAERFEIEARLLSSLSHPRVVAVSDHFQDAAGHFLVMDLIEGPDLASVLLERGKPGLPVPEVVRWMQQACDALQYVHDQQIIHRDVKPQNLILSDSSITLVDFGIARAFESDSLSPTEGTRGIGTRGFMAPEVFLGGTVSPRADVFGIAATMYTLLAGSPPNYRTAQEVDEKLPNVPPPMRRALEGGLQLLPEQRVPSAAAFAEMLGTPIKPAEGRSLAVSTGAINATQQLLFEGIVKTAAGVMEAAASSIALLDREAGELVYEAAWGAGAREIVGIRMSVGEGIAGAVVRRGMAEVVPECRNDARFAARVASRTGYVPVTMLVVPLMRNGNPIGALSLIDRRGGGRYGPEDVGRAQLFADLVVTAMGTSA